MSTFTLQNIGTIQMTDTVGNVSGASITPVNGGVSVDGYFVATTGVSAGTLRLTTSSITDTSGSISFEDDNLSTSGGVSFSGGVSLNGYTYPTSLGTSQFLYYKNNATGVSGYGLTGGSNITLTYGETGVTISSSGGGGGGVTDINDLTDAATNSTTVILGNAATPGTNSVAVGISAGFNSSALTDSVMLGFNAGNIGNTFQDFIGIGTGVASSNGGNVLHQKSVAIGTCALTSLQTSGTEGNTAIGFEAGKLLQDASFNTFIGHQAGDSVTTGSNVTCIGSGADATTPTTGNEVTLGNGSVTKLRCASQTIASISDSRDKTNVTDLQYGIDFIENIRPVEFTWERRPIHTGDQENPTNGTRKTGFLAQELLEAMPDGENEILDLVCEENPERLEAKYNNLIPILVKAVKDLKAEVDTLKQRMDACSC